MAPNFEGVGVLSGRQGPFERNGFGVRRFISALARHVPLYNQLDDKTQHAKSQAQEDHESAKLASFRFPCQLSNDEQHVEHERPHADREAEPGDLLFVKAKHI